MKKDKKFHVLANLKDPVYLLVFIGSVFLFFDLQYYLMASLPGTKDFMCVDGANLTPLNVIFSLVLSLLVGLIVASLTALFRKTVRQKKAALTSVTGLGMGLGALTLFCPICALPVISVFGFSLGLDFINDYNIWLKLLSIGMLAVSLLMVNRRLDPKCKVCAMDPLAVKE